MDQAAPEIRKIASLSNTQARNKEKSNLLALISATLHYFIDMIIDEVNRAGFTQVEFLEKIIFFLRATTPSYSDEKYLLILQTLVEVDKRFPETEFFYGLESMRKIATGDNKKSLEIIQGTFKVNIDIDFDQYADLTFYTTYLIENTIAYITRLRMSNDVMNKDNAYLKKTIDDRYDNCVLQTVLMLEEIKKI